MSKIKNLSARTAILPILIIVALATTGCGKGFDVQMSNASSNMALPGSNNSGANTPEDNGHQNTPDIFDPQNPQGNLPAAYMDTKPLWEAKVSNSTQWSAHVMRELDVLGKDLLDVKITDGAKFCPRYNYLNYQERKLFWTHMISIMTRFESGFKPTEAFKESFNDSTGKPVISRGLLQISIESGKAYGCPLKVAEDLHDPYKNLSCGIRILNRWLARDGRIAGKVGSNWQGGARYWSVLRAGDKESYNTIVSKSRNLKMCN